MESVECHDGDGIWRRWGEVGEVLEVPVTLTLHVCFLLFCFEEACVWYGCFGDCITLGG
jgi:hypothetical protein